MTVVVPSGSGQAVEDAVRGSGAPAANEAADDGVCGLWCFDVAGGDAEGGRQ
jgi:hypothetical protein